MSTRASTTEHWLRIIHQQRCSGLSVVAFCRQNRVAESSFFAWRRRLVVSAPAAATPAFVEVKAATQAARPSRTPQDCVGVIELTVSGDRRLWVTRGFDSQALRELILLLESLPSASGVVA